MGWIPFASSLCLLHRKREAIPKSANCDTSTVKIRAKSLSRFTRRIFVSIIPALFTSFGWCRRLRNCGKESPRSHLRKSNQIPAVRLTHPFETTSADMKVVKRGELESFDRYPAVILSLLFPVSGPLLPPVVENTKLFGPSRRHLETASPPT
jgi:hypothetical protein